jgi:hypothetical protein
MREDFSTVHMVGRDAAGLTARWLPYPLGHMLRFWCAQYRVQQGRSDEALTIEEVLLAGPEQRVLHPLEDRFRANVTDSETARTEMEFFFRSTVSQHPLLMVVGPEGVGKTSVLMALHHEFVADLERRRESTLAMYVFDDYADAATKCTAFNDVQAANGFIGVVIPSFSRAYEEECAALGITAISTGEAAHRGFTSRWKAISALQPSIIERLRARCTSLWASIGDKKPVFFSVHQVAHEWRKSTPSRLMWSRAFWEEWADDKERLDACRKETKLGLLVHDEAKAETIVDMQPFEIVQWVEDLVNSDTEVWCAEWRPLPSLLASYEAFVAERGDPVVAGNSTPITFEEVRRIEEVGYSLWDHVETADSGEYGCRPASNDNGGEEDGDTPERRDIYAARHGRSWGVSSRHWWRGAADRVVLLTTEAVPTALARVADSSWAVFELETPNVPRDTVEVHASRFVRGDNLATICADFRDEHPDDDFVIISNRVAMMTETVTHAGARGSNDLIGRNVMQTMTFMTPGEYERLQALNAWTGRSDLVSLRHVDEFNQSAGRNLGFRRRGEVKHVLLVNRRLFGLLVGAAGALTHSRYDMRLHLDADERYEIKRAA